MARTVCAPKRYASPKPGETDAGQHPETGGLRALKYALDGRVQVSEVTYGDDTYWGGKSPQEYAEFALMAKSIGDTADYNILLDNLRTITNVVDVAWGAVP